MRLPIRRRCAVLAALCVFTTSCAKREAPRGEAQPSAAPVQSASGLTSELDQLVKLSKGALSAEQKHARLQAVLEKFPAEHSKKREELIVAAVARGAHDPPVWTTIVSTYKGRRAEIQVSTDALKILGVRVDVTAEGAQRIADSLGTILPTPRILQLIWEQADVRIEPCTSLADAQMATTARMVRHSECVDQRVGDRKGMVANEGKHWVLSNRTAGKENLAANYGWFIKGRRPIQTVGTRHDTAHTDYSQIVRLVKPIIRVDGREIDIRSVGRSPELWGLVSDEGPLLVWRASGSDPTPSATTAIAPVPPPKPGDPRAVHVTLRQERAPLTPEQLPETTTALRRNSLSRRVVAALRLRPEDVPEAAFRSGAAAACGGRDVFFELMNGIPVDRIDLERQADTLRAAFDCGKSLVPQLRAGAAVFEVEYAFEGVPTSFALLSLRDDSFREKVLYAPLSPTPSGVHRAYCNDDTGSPRSVCGDGARSRLLFAVNGGYLAAFAAEAPSLLERLARSSPPPPDVSELVELFREPSAAEDVAIAKGGNCGFAVDFTFVDLSPDETNRQRIIDAINDNALFCGTHSSGSVLNASRRLVFVGKDDAAALAIEAALKRRALEVRFESGVATAKDDALRRFNDAMRSAAARTARAATIERKGRRLSLAMALDPSDAEQRDMAALLDARAAKAKRAAVIVEELAAGKLPAQPQLDAFREPAANGVE